MWEVGGDGEARVISIADVAGHSSRRCLSLHIAAAARHSCASFLSNELNQATLKSPGIENKMEILIGQNQGC